jgi:hypothetical protein
MGEERLAPELHVVDDGGTRAGVRRALEEVAEADLLVGPYGSDLVDEAARWAAGRGRVLWNHGGSADEVERLPGVVSVPSPASRYLGAVLEALADSLPGARVLVATRRGLFGRSAALGARDAADRLGMTIVGTVAPGEVPEASDADVVLAAGASPTMMMAPSPPGNRSGMACPDASTVVKRWRMMALAYPAPPP